MPPGKKPTRGGGSRKTCVVVRLRPPPGHPRNAVEETRALIEELRACLLQAEDRVARAQAILPETWQCHPPEPEIDEPLFSRETAVLEAEALLTAEQTGARLALRRLAEMFRRWSSDWQGLKDNGEFEARMRFTVLVEQRAGVVRDHGAKREGPARHAMMLAHAQDIIERVQFIHPGARIDAAYVVRAIEKKATATGRWDWQSMSKAWCGGKIDAEIWRVGWSKWSNEKA